MVYLKGYMKAVKTHLQATNPDRVPIFEKKAQEQAKKILANFKDYEFYTGASLFFQLLSDFHMQSDQNAGQPRRGHEP